MHPNPAFEWTDRTAMLDFLTQTAFATIFVTTPDRPRTVYAPVLVTGDRHLQFHISRRNGAASLLDGTGALVSCMGAHAYLSPDWYGTPDQVPTWNYVVVEGEGRLRKLPEEALAPLLDGLSAVQEARLVPKPPWLRDKMKPGRFEAMVKAIVGYELEIEALRGVRKLGQNKSSAEIAAACAGLRADGRDEMAALMSEVGT